MIARAVLIISFALAAFAARADAHCSRPSVVVGYRRCSQYGWWSETIGWNYQLGPTLLHMDPALLAGTSTVTSTSSRTTTAQFVPVAGAHPLTAYGGTLHVEAGALRHLFFGIEVSYAEIADGPQMIAADTARAGAPLTQSAATGFVSGGGLVFAYRDLFGRFTAGAEMVIAIRMADFGAAKNAFSTQTSFAPQLRGQADFWLSRTWTVGVRAGTDVTELGAFTLTVDLGAHLFPFDGQR